MAKAKRKTKAQKVARQRAAVAPVGESATAVSSRVAPVQAAQPVNKPAAAAPAVRLPEPEEARIAHVKADVRTASFLTVTLLAVMVVLSIVLNSTDFGADIYDSIQIN